MERVWKRVQSASGGASGSNAAPAAAAAPAPASAPVAATAAAPAGNHRRHASRCGCPVQPCQLHVDQRAKRGRANRKSRASGGPQTIVCSCQTQPCPVHPVLIRVRRARPASSCECPAADQPCAHSSSRGSFRRSVARRCECTEKPCRHAPGGPSTAKPAVEACDCLDKTSCQHQASTAIDPYCECEAKPCEHTIKSRRHQRSRTCECPSQPCAHKPTEGRIKRVKYRVRRAGCAMARCTAELAMLHLHWELATECAPCKPRALTRRLCRRQQSDNELYRSNSFKFERFERSKDEAAATPLRKQVSLCDDYSLPVDFVNKRRPVSAAAAVATTSTTIQWALPSPTVESAERVEVVEQYSDPRDSKSKAYVEPGAETSLPSSTTFNKINRDYCRPYTDPSASGSSCEDEVELFTIQHQQSRQSNCRKRRTNSYTRANSGKESLRNDTSTIDCVALVHSTDQSPTEINQPIRHPSPYYYSDLLKNNDQQQSQQQQYHQQPQQQSPKLLQNPSKYRKSISLDVPNERSRTPALGCLKRNSLTENLPARYPNPEPLISPTSSNGHGIARINCQDEILSSCIITEWDHTLMPPHRLLSHDIPSAVCTCLNGSQEDEDELEFQQLPQFKRQQQQQHRYHYHHQRQNQHQHQQHQLRKERKPKLDPILIENEDDVEGEDEADEEEEEEEEEEEDEEDEEMARQRHLYETAFDCKVSRSDDDLDDLDRVTNHPVLHSQVRGGSSAQLLTRASSSTDSASRQHVQYSSVIPKDRRKVILLRPKAIPSRLQPHELLQQQQQQHQESSHSQQQQQLQQPQIQPDNISNLSQELESLQVNSSDEKTAGSSPRLQTRCYTPSPPSTAPLPAKFHGNNSRSSRDSLLLNIRSAPNLPSQQQQENHQHARLKDIRLPIKSSLKSKPKELSPQTSDNSILEIKGRPKDNLNTRKDFILEFKGRPNDRKKERPRSLIREDSRSIIEFKGRPNSAEIDDETIGGKPRRDLGLLELKLRTSSNRRKMGYSSTESMATSSSGGSMESLRSSTSEGNRSTSSSESRHSTSLSSHSSDSGNCYSHHHHHHHHHQQSGGSLSGFLTHHSNKLHILSPISDKSSQEPASETSDNNRNNNSQKASPEELTTATESVPTAPSGNQVVVVSPMDSTSFNKKRIRQAQNKNLINLALQSSSSGDAEIQGSDSGISIESRAGIKCKPFGFHLLKPHLDNINNIVNIDNNDTELSDLPFDMPKLRRRRLLMQQDPTTSGSATSVDLRDLPFDMPKLRRRLRCTQSVESSTSQASSSLSVRDVEPPALFGGSLARPKMTLNLDSGGYNNTCGAEGTGGPIAGLKKPAGLNLGLSLEITTTRDSADLVDVDLPLERQGWYHGSITRIEAEAVLRLLREGSYLVRNSESTKQDYSLSLKSARGFMHMRIQKNEDLNAYILGQFSKPFDSIPEMVRHFSVNRLPIRGAEHMCLLHPVIAQLL